MSGDYSSSNPSMAQSLLPDDISAVLADYTFPEQPNSLNLLMTSQYAKVIFHDIADTYPTDADICCRYTLTNGVIPTQGDRIALYKVGWSSVEEFIHFEYAPVQDLKQSECQVLFKASSLPKDISDFYQLAYLTSESSVCGLSVPFQFRRPFDEELCSFEEQDGLVIIRSKAAINEEKLHEAEKVKANLQQEKFEAETKLRELEESESKKNKELEEAMAKLESIQNEKKSLESKLEESMHIERHLARLKQDLLSLDQEKNESEMKLQKAEAHIQVLSATVDTLTSDKEHMSELLRNEAKQNVEYSQYKNQADNLQHMLDVMTQSKEMVKQELLTEMDLNQKLRDELRLLQTEVNNLKDMLALRESEKNELYNKILLSDVETKELKKALEDTLTSKQQTNDMLNSRIHELEKNKDHLLSELIKISGKDKEDKDKISLLTDQLTKAMSDVTLLQQELEDTNNSLKEERQNTSHTMTSTSILEKSVQQLKLELHVALEQKKKLQRNVELLHEEVDNLKKELLAQKERHRFECNRHVESEKLSKKMSLYETSASIECRREELDAHLKEVKEKEKVQQDRLVTISSRLSEVCEEEDKLTVELQQVQQTYLEKNEQLRNLKGRASFQDNPFDPATEGNWSFAQTLTTMDEELQNIECCVESSHLRQVQLELQIRELSEEKAVLSLQADNASEKLQNLVAERRDIVNHLSELDTEEINLLRQNIEDLQFPKDQGNSNGTFDEEKRKLLFMLEDCSNLDEKSAKEKEEEMKLRLRLAAAEYRKLYMEKIKIEKRLTRLMQKLSEKKSKSTSEEAQTEQQLVNLSETSTLTRSPQAVPQAARQSNASVCPFCSVTFPPGSYDLFATHFENHLS